MYRILIILLFLMSASLWAQDYSSTSKKAIKHFEMANEFFKQKQDKQAEEFLRKAIAEDGNFYEAWFMLAQIYMDNHKGDKAAEYYLNGLEADPEKNRNNYLKLADLEYSIGLYSEAAKHLEKWYSFGFNNQRSMDKAEDLDKRLAFALDALKHPVPFQPVSLGPAVNTSEFEYWPSLSIDEKTLFFTVLGPPNPELSPTHLLLQEDFYFATKQGDHWVNRTYLGAPVNTNSNEGAQSITADGSVIYFTACNTADGHGRLCDIYYSEVGEDGAWTQPKNLGDEVNTRYSEKHPSISADGRILYFSSNRPGGKGNYDIWMTFKRGDTWTKPINLGDSINTKGLEQSPFIHSDQRTLYFSSNGWPGMGQADIFMSRWQEAGWWQMPKNLGFPINTYNEEIGFIVNAEGDRAYYSSNRREGTDTDIFTFTLPEDVRPNPVSYIAGRVYDARTYKGIEATFQLIELETGGLIMEERSHPGEGNYLIGLPSGNSYAFNVSEPGYLFYSDHFDFSGEHSRTEPFQKDIQLEPIQTGKMIVLKNIFFDTDTYTLKNESVVELNKIKEFLELNPGVRIEISGHTDTTGSDEYNQELSVKRAQSVVHFLVDAGIPAERLEAKGYGASRPVAKNDTEEGRAKNRRTELKIL